MRVAQKAKNDNPGGCLFLFDREPSWCLEGSDLELGVSKIPV